MKYIVINSWKRKNIYLNVIFIFILELFGILFKMGSIDVVCFLLILVLFVVSGVFEFLFWFIVMVNGRILLEFFVKLLGLVKWEVFIV